MVCPQQFPLSGFVFRFREIFSRLGGVRSWDVKIRNFFALGSTSKAFGFRPARVHTGAHMPARGRRKSPVQKQPVFPRFAYGFGRMTCMTERLQVAFVREQLPVSTMRRYVVNIGGTHTLSVLRTLSAKRFVKQLLLPKPTPHRR